MLSIARSLDRIGNVPKMGDRRAEPKKVKFHRRLRPPILITAFAAFAITSVIFVGILGQPKEESESQPLEISTQDSDPDSLEADPEPQIVPRKESVAARQAEISVPYTVSSPPATGNLIVSPAGATPNPSAPPALPQPAAPTTSPPPGEKNIPSRHGGTVAPFTVELDSTK